MAAPTQYAPRFDVVDLIQRGLTMDVVCPVYRGAQLVAPSAGTITIYDDSAVAVVSAANAPIVNGVATYTVSSATTTGRDLARGWRLEWALTMPDGVVHTFRNESGLVRCVPFPVLSEPALYRRCPALDPSGAAPITRAIDYQAAIDDAWVTIRNRLDEMGTRVELVVSPTRLRESHLLLTLHIIFADLASRNPAHQASADAYHKQYEAAWARSSLEVDENDDGDGDKIKPTRPPLWAM